jgi:hypothetical protein
MRDYTKYWFAFVLCLMVVIIILNIVLAVHCGQFKISDAPAYCLLLAGG